MNNPDNSQKPKDTKGRFLFDLNNFDTPKEEEIEIIEEVDIEPPAPTFSEDELDAAKAIAESQGEMQGRQQEKESREQFIADSLQKIGESFSSLFAAETYRERQYEEESLKLALEIIDILAPSLNDRLGKEALQSALKSVLKRQSQQSEIRIEVDPESASDIDKYVESIWKDKENAPRYKVVAESGLEKGACHIHWEDGGMVRNPQKTANDIKEAIEALLVEQVMGNNDTAPNSPLTDASNNAINNEETSDSLNANSAQQTPDASTKTSNKEDKHD